MFNDELLKEGTDYILSYKNNNMVTKGKGGNIQPIIIVKGKGNYKGSVNIKFGITKQDISQVKMKASDRIYQNKEGAYVTRIKLIDTNGKELVAGKDYNKKVLYTYAESTKLANDVMRKAGDEIQKKDILPEGTKVRVTIYAKEGSNYTGNVTTVYRIVKSDISKAKVSVQAQVYTGSEIKPEKNQIVVKVQGRKLNDEDYEIVGYGADCIKRGKNTITLKGTGNYGGTKEATYVIKSKGILWWWKK